MNSKFQSKEENVDKCEAAIMQQIDAAYGRCAPSFTRNVRAKTGWGQLYEAPITLQLKIDWLIEPISAQYDCHLEPSLNCTCYKCQTALREEIQYYERIQEQSVTYCWC